MRRLRMTVAIALAGALVAACTISSESGDDSAQGGGFGDPGDCIVVDMAISAEKIDLLTDLAQTFNDSDEAVVGDRCVFVRPRSVASGGAAQLLTQGWPDENADGPRPVVWSPAASTWGAIVNQRLADQGQEPIAPESRPFMLSPLVLAMPQPMAEALGYPETPVGFADVLELARNEEGWGAFGEPQWGPFRLGKTNPNFSTSGLAALLAQYYAATGKTENLTIEDLARPDVQDFARGVESAVVHYGDTTLTFLNNLARADARGTSLTYASAVAIEEVSLINYNRGNPDGVLQPGEQPAPPRIPLVAIYPEEGTLFSDNPYIILDAEWVSDDQKQAAALFEEFVQRPENQQRVLEFGFRPGNPEVAVGAPIVTENGVDPAQPETSLEVPDPPVMIEALDRWSEQRKPARVLLTLDVSGSMGDFAGGDTRETKLDVAKRAAISALDLFSRNDEVGLRVFSTDVSTTEPLDYLDLVPIGPITEQQDELARRIESLVPLAGTPLYTATEASYDTLVESFAPDRINAVVLLSDGQNDDPRNDDLDGLLEHLRQGTEGGTSTPVRVFPIAYGGDADLGTLRRIAEATNAAVYDASDARSIDKVLTAVVSNF